MKAGFYPRLAFDGIRKNKRMYLPYILTCIGMVTMHYIIMFLQYGEAISYLPGVETVRAMIGMGGGVIAVFACVFLFYTNSFLIRRRKKEFGLYNILGMGKMNIARVLFWEAFIIALSSLVIGLVCGIALSKLAELGLVNIMKGDVNYTLSLSVAAIKSTITLFAVIFLLIFLNSLRQIRFSSAVSLLRSENIGEKPPKGNWFIGILGVLILAAAYYIAIIIKEPLAAIAVFFAAVVMVIAGTYLIMISGSVLFCRILQKRKSYYYMPNHFVSVSSMTYRMKRNGAGLASICILATMVLVMISSTTSLYFGGEDSINSRYPREINLDFTMKNTDGFADENTLAIYEDVLSIAKKYGVTPENSYYYRSAAIAGLLENNTVETDVTKLNSFNIDTYSNVYQFYFIPLADYNRTMGTNETLADGEALIYVYRGDYKGDTISFIGGNSFKIKKQLDDFIGSGETAMIMSPSMAIIVPDLDQSIQGLDKLADYNGDRMVQLKWTYNFDTGIKPEEQTPLYKELFNRYLDSSLREGYGVKGINFESRERNRSDFYGLYGGLFYLGIILSIVFIFAAVLIIYYKQISEGYEDQSRFEIMQKVGMTKREIRKSINSQLLTVFFLPLIFAAMHLAFAFPIIRRLLLLFNLNNVMLFAATTVISVLAFALFYTLVYRITSNAYYHIVSGAKNDGR